MSTTTQSAIPTGQTVGQFEALKRSKASLAAMAEYKAEQAQAQSQSRHVPVDTTDDEPVEDAFGRAAIDQMFSEPVPDHAPLHIPTTGSHTPQTPPNAIQSNPWAAVTPTFMGHLHSESAPTSAPLTPSSATSQIAPGTLSAGATPRSTALLVDPFTTALDSIQRYGQNPPTPPAVKSTTFYVPTVQTRPGAEALRAKSLKSNIEFMNSMIDLQKAAARAQETYANACWNRSNYERYIVGLNARKKAENKAADDRLAAHKAKRAKKNPVAEVEQTDY